MNTAAEWLTAVATALSSLFIGLGALFAVRQLRVGNRTNQLQAIIRVTDLMIEPDVMRSRRWVMENQDRLRLWPPKADADIARENAETVCRALDRVGLLVEHKLVDAVPVLDMWSVSIERLHDILVPFLAYRRAETPHFVHNFDYLHGEAHKYNQIRHRQRRSPQRHA